MTTTPHADTACTLLPHLQELGLRYGAPLDASSQQYQTDKQRSAVHKAAKALSCKAAASIPPALRAELQAVILQHFRQEPQAWPASLAEQQQLLAAAAAVDPKSVVEGWQSHAAVVVAAVVAEGERLQQQQQQQSHTKAQDCDAQSLHIMALSLLTCLFGSGAAAAAGAWHTAHCAGPAAAGARLAESEAEPEASVSLGLQRRQEQQGLRHALQLLPSVATTAVLYGFQTYLCAAAAGLITAGGSVLPGPAAGCCSCGSNPLLLCQGSSTAGPIASTAGDGAAGAGLEKGSMQARATNSTWDNNYILQYGTLLKTN